jgi:hypothetical protein
MKSTFIKVVPVVVVSLPKLMISHMSGMIIMATSLGPDGIHGMIIHTGSQQHRIGSTHTDFIEDIFEDFHGTVTIEA